MNYIKQVAEMLGVEVGEEFKIKDITFKYKFGDDGLLFLTVCGEWAEAGDTTLKRLITGECEVIKLPFKPKEGEKYWSYLVKRQGASQLDWNNRSDDYAYWKIGNCFRTKEEAEVKGKELMEKIKEEYYNA